MTATEDRSAPALPQPRPAAEGTELRTSAAIQGNVLAAFNKDFQTFLFLQLPSADQGRVWLHGVLPRIATTAQVATFNEAFSKALRNSGSDPERMTAVWVSLSLTAPGLNILVPDAVQQLQAPGMDPGVRLFLEGAAEQADTLGDTGDSAPKYWVFGRPAQPIHAILTVAADRSDDLAVEVQRQREYAAEHGLLEVFEQSGATLPGPHKGQEHFGFKDGISQPGVIGFDPSDPVRQDQVKGKPGTDLVAAGEFVLGYPGQDGRFRQVPEWFFDGSFLVIRRLAQDVPGWWSQVERAYEGLPEADRDQLSSDALAAKLVGRWRSGTPVDKAPDRDIRGSRQRSEDNEFEFADDANGVRCPRFAHIRKVYPRQAPPPSPGEDVSNQHRILRRGIPFGPAFDPTAGRGHGIDSQRGLLFACYQSSIEGQFQFLQQLWANDPDVPAPNDGPDPVIGVDGKVVLHKDGGETTELPVLRRFVRTQASLYAVTPSIPALEAIATGELT
jgi:Dyp-type peroxidase family